MSAALAKQHLSVCYADNSIEEHPESNKAMQMCIPDLFVLNTAKHAIRILVGIDSVAANHASSKLRDILDLRSAQDCHIALV